MRNVGVSHHLMDLVKSKPGPVACANKQQTTQLPAFLSAGTGK
ncbi:hypothetical protein H180DRAFT_04205 [Streptomyces sp. WMMB 322]|nr:hypothetical protein H180DRAFT_04205 [Streptomyces sp. WMMB 322]